MEQTSLHLLSTIPSQLGKHSSPLPQDMNPGGPNRRKQIVVLGLHIFRNFIEKQ